MHRRGMGKPNLPQYGNNAAWARLLTLSMMPQLSKAAENAWVLPIEYAGQSGLPVRSASLARPFRRFSSTTSLPRLVRKIPAMPSGTTPTLAPSAVAFAIDFPDTSTTP